MFSLMFMLSTKIDSLPREKNLCKYTTNHFLTLSIIMPSLMAFSKRIYSKTPFYRVFFRGVTWLRDSHGLFDYESKNISKKNMKTQSQGQFFRINDEIEFVSLSKKEEDMPGFTPESVKSLITLKHDKSMYNLMPQMNV